MEKYILKKLGLDRLFAAIDKLCDSLDKAGTKIDSFCHKMDQLMIK